MAVFTLKELRRFLKGKSLKQINVVLAPGVVDELLKEKDNLVDIERRFRTKINLVSNPACHIEQIKIS